VLPQNAAKLKKVLKLPDSVYLWPIQLKSLGSIRKQSITNAVITYSGVLIGFISLLFIQPNLLKPEELGLTRILLAAASLVASLLPLGVSSVTTKFFPYFRNKEKGHHGYFVFMLLFPLAGTLICAALIYLFKDWIILQYAEQSPLFIRYFHLLLPFAMIMGLNMALNSYSASLFKTTVVSLFEGVITRLLFILIIVLYYLQYIDLSSFVSLFILIYLLQTIGVFIYLWVLDKPSLKLNMTQLREVGLNKMIFFGLLLTLTNISSLSMRHLDAVMIGKYMKLEFVGIFAVAAYLALVIEIPLTSMERITHAKVSEAWANKDLESIRKIYYQSVKYLMLAGGLLLVGITTNIHELLNLLPAPYHGAAAVAIIAACGSFLNISTGVNTSILFTSDKYLYGTFLLFFLLLLTFLLNIYLIPQYGIEGAAAATAMATIIYNFLKYLIILKYYKMQPYDLGTLKILAVIACAFAVGIFMPVTDNGIVTIILRSSAVTAAYLVLSYMLNIVPEFHKYIPWNKGK
jgi:O-antigen/teichoic acid export membrane protein